MSNNNGLAPLKGIPLGVWMNHKGGWYETLGTGRHSESTEEVVLYKNIQGDIWVRPWDMWHDNVFVEATGLTVPRFRLIAINTTLQEWKLLQDSPPQDA